MKMPYFVKFLELPFNAIKKIYQTSNTMKAQTTTVWASGQNTGAPVDSNYFLAANSAWSIYFIM